MSSWRDGASTEAQDDFDALLNVGLGFAQNQLAQRGEFYPFAIAMDLQGTPETMEVALGDDHPLSEAVIEACTSALADRRAGIRASAIVFDVRLDPNGPVDAIQVDLEHAEGQALTVQLPYTRKRRKRIAYGQLSASTGPRRVWPLDPAI